MCCECEVDSSGCAFLVEETVNVKVVFTYITNSHGYKILLLENIASASNKRKFLEHHLFLVCYFIQSFEKCNSVSTPTIFFFVFTFFFFFFSFLFLLCLPGKTVCIEYIQKAFENERCDTRMGCSCV